MRRLLISIIILALVSTPGLFTPNKTWAAEENTLLITEIMYNPAGEDEIVFAGRKRNRQWFELYNPTSQAFTISGGLRAEVWTLLDSTGAHFLAKNAWQGTMVINPGETIILAGDAQIFLQEYQNYQGTVIDAKMELAHDFEFIQLKNEEGKVVAQTPLSFNIGGNGNGKTVEFYPGGTAGESLVVGGTPGQRSLQPTSRPASTPTASISVSPVIPVEVIEPSPWLEFLPSGKVVINEISGGSAEKWLELKNLEDYGIDLTGWKIRAASSDQTLVLAQKIQDQGLVLIEGLEKKISLDLKVEKLQLFDSGDNLVFQVEYQNSLPQAWSAVRFPQGWQLTTKPTPGAENELTLPENLAPQEVPVELIPALSIYSTFNTDQNPEPIPWLFLLLSGSGLALSASLVFLRLKKKLIY